MNAKRLEKAGVVGHSALVAARGACARAGGAGLGREEIEAAVRAVVAGPGGFVDDPLWGELARELLAFKPFQPQRAAGKYRVWGEGLDEQSLEQLRRACSLPITAAGALMPDAHVGYGLPIGGVLATRGAVIPYAVGVDIACRMKLSVVDVPATALDAPHTRQQLIRAIEERTRFGVGAEFERPHEHAVMDEDWGVTEVTKRLKRKAEGQLGTSGSGNHFVEWGVLTVTAPPTGDGAAASSAAHGVAVGGSGWDWGLQPGTYLALLSHSGSRGTGAAVCDYYSKLARQMHPELPRELAELAWLDLASGEGQEYLAAMNLMGRYAAANHACIHTSVCAALGAQVIAGVENHHNFAWMERHDLGDGAGPQDLLVHRKGATPAFAGVMGVIPGSMATPGWVVRGRGCAGALMSASHGAGRAMSRTKAREAFVWGNVRRELEAAGVQVLSCGLDEVPGAYKNIETVMAAQQDLVEVVGRFDPKIVKMAPPGERPED